MVRSSIEVALQSLQNDSTKSNNSLYTILGGEVTVELLLRDTKCDVSLGIHQLFLLLQKEKFYMVIGPACDYVAAPVIRELKYWGIPVITAGAFAYDFSKKKDMYGRLTRIGATANSLADAILTIVNRFGWSRLLILYEREAFEDKVFRFCLLSADAIEKKLTTKKAEVEYQNIILKNIEDILTNKLGLRYAGRKILFYHP
ncbi:unnamed protein product [Dimorphilus gyrociliatus]|uniref:Receptor ligand binding region domain-containing protein n=1 Tax=Dimorphilus gyrociliatus TaxID=2664684 RepID=A0A7I8V964_9ANNE|nr:unnamed protein product [Dimorphilus gyrociliatus]